jgi:hypothetical protein
MKGYIYIGEHYDVLERKVGISDKKIGQSIDPVSRENSLNRTKSPVGYRILEVFFVDNMDKVENLLHAILNSRNTEGEWFRDDEDTLVSEFVKFMSIYDATRCDIEELKPTALETDDRLKSIGEKYGTPLSLIRPYKGLDYEVILTSSFFLKLVITGEEFNTPNKLYNNGIVKHNKGVRGNSGTNYLSQFRLNGKFLID